MAPQKNKNKQVITEEPESSNKRRRVEILNGTNGVPFTNPFTQFPSIHMLQQQQHRSNNYPPRNTATMVIGTDLNLYHPSSQIYQQQEEEEEDDKEENDYISSLIPQQNFIINYHINLMLQSVEEFWRKNLSVEIKKKKEMEAMLKEKERQADLFKQMYFYYEERAFHLEDMLQRRMHRPAGEGCSNAVVADHQDEEVQSCFVDLNTATTSQRMDDDMACRNCLNRPATMLWMPCRHLCVCMVCERRVRNCPICGAKKTESFKINLPVNN